MSLETTADPRLRALAHPLRLRLLGLLTARPVSATEVAAATGLAHAAASYHLRQLASSGLIETVPERASGARRGRPRVRYRLRDDAFRGLGRASSRLLDRALLAELARRLGERGVTKRISDAEVWLAPADWRAVRELSARASGIVHDRALAPRAAGARHVGATTVLLEFAR